jgi:hypothetical protein
VALKQLLLREDGDSILDKNKKMVVIGCGHWSVIKSYKGEFVYYSFIMRKN